jgi:sugar lactone lactonase YvrE
MPALEIKRVGDTVDRLGEGLLWDNVQNVLYWTDALEGIVHRLDPATAERKDLRLPDQIGALALRESGDAIVTLTDGVYFLDLTTGATQPAVLFNHGRDDIRFNDGAVDRQGRFLAGTMHIRPPADGVNVGTLHRFDPDGATEVLEQGIGNTNGTCFSPDGRTFYFTDSPRREIYAYRYDTKTGRPNGRRIFAETGSFDSPADGQTVDADGFLWSALVTAGKVARFDPAGRLDRLIELPVRHPTNVAFGGPDLDVLYVTSISKSPNITATEHGAGGLYAIRGLGVTGLAEPRFAG